MFKLALGAGHSFKTAGKRCLKELDPKETREWWLNDRICDYIEELLRDYSGYELLRLDDSDDGADDIPLATRVNIANKWEADFYLSIHHNAGIKGGTGGGIVSYMYPGADSYTQSWRDDLYDALIKKTGLKGNRAKPKSEGNYYVLRESKMSATLLELGFMDSQKDVPIILSDDYARKCAEAIVEVIVKKANLKKIETKPASTTLYRVQVGAFESKLNAEKLLAKLKADGYSAYIKKA